MPRTKTRRIIPVQVLMVLTPWETDDFTPYCKRKFVDIFPIREDAVAAGKELGLEELELKIGPGFTSIDLFAHTEGPLGKKKFIVFEGQLALNPGSTTTGAILMGPVKLKRKRHPK